MRDHQFHIGPDAAKQGVQDDSVHSAKRMIGNDDKRAGFRDAGEVFIVHTESHAH